MNSIKYLLVAMVAIFASGLAMADWNNERIAMQWSKATGYVMHSDEQAAVLEENIVTVVDVDGTERFTYVWVTTSSIDIPQIVETHEMNEWGGHTHLRQYMSIASGFVISNGERDYFIVVILKQEASTEDKNHNAVSASSSSILPLRSVANEREGDQYVEALQFSSYDGPPHIECYDNTWTGKDGIQCCGYLSALREGLEACSARYWSNIIKCVPASLTVGGGVFAWCARHCVVPPAIPACLKGCLILGGVSSVGTFFVCWAGVDFAYEECCAEKRSQYWRDLTSAGCSLRSPDETADSKNGGV